MVNDIILLSFDYGIIHVYYHHVQHYGFSNMRWDSLAQIISLANIHAGCRTIVFDSVLGLVVGSLAYRMRGM